MVVGLFLPRNWYILQIFEVMTRRLGLHVGFWLMYLLINSYLEVFLVGASYSNLSLWHRFGIGLATESFLLPVKIGVAYLILYGLLEPLLKKGQLAALAFYALFVLAIAAVLNLAAIYGLVFPFVYQEAPEPSIFSVPRFFWSLLDIAWITGLAAAFKLLRSQLKSLEVEQRLTQEKLQSELRFLKAQMNPHFLFNTLNNLYGLARKQSSQTEVVILRLSKLLRFMLYECAADQIFLSDELKIIKDYIALEQIRYDQRLKVVYKESIDDYKQKIAPLLLLPFVENAFKHGVEDARFDALIEIAVQLQEGQFSFLIKNTVAEDGAHKSEGIGLQNVKRQLELLYPERYHLAVEKLDGFFIVHLKISDRSKLSDNNFHPVKKT